MVVVSVLYPATVGVSFDHAYYDATHIPLVKAAFTATGLTDVKVFHGLSAADGGPAPFVAMAHLTFESPEALGASMGGPRGDEIRADVVNFTTIQPVIQVSTVS
ncbi:EthD family reductase [Caulobacter soli]|uniref:EthD family reductase n=1 Tax=Caulobacter soli TaxID=2708539 RepID=UPI0013ED80A4|nr:EthD family reductase [Caulobacter soli]